MGQTIALAELLVIGLGIAAVTVSPLPPATKRSYAIGL